MNGKLIKLSFREALYTVTSASIGLYIECLVCALIELHYCVISYLWEGKSTGNIIICIVLLGGITKETRLFRGYKLLPFDDKNMHKFNVLASVITWCILTFLISVPSIIGLCVQGRFNVIYVPFALLFAAGGWNFGMYNLRTYKLKVIHKIIDVLYIVVSLIWLSFCLENSMQQYSFMFMEIIFFAIYSVYHYFRIRKYTIDQLNYEGVLNSKAANLVGGHL